MKTIWKFAIPITDETVLKMPKSPNILCAQVQGASAKEIMLWAIVDPQAELEMHKFRVVGTGHPFPDAAVCVYIDTVQMGDRDWPLVFHVFEEYPEVAEGRQNESRSQSRN